MCISPDEGTTPASYPRSEPRSISIARCPVPRRVHGLTTRSADRPPEYDTFVQTMFLAAYAGRKFYSATRSRNVRVLSIALHFRTVADEQPCSERKSSAM
jgi:hypothetical protein